MLKFKTKHFLTGEELSQEELNEVLTLAETLKTERQSGDFKKPLLNKHLAMIFEKQSLRTRMSFTVAAHELGGNVIESTSQTAKKEEPEDVVRVLAGYCHAIVVRTHDHMNLDRMTAKSPIPVINGLSDTHHPCQILADLLTLKQVYGNLKGLEVAYVGDGNNILHSLMLLAPFLGVHLRHACPPGYSPSAFIEKRAKARMKEGGGSIKACKDPVQAVKGAHAIYTDTWTSMGFEKEEKERNDAFEGYQVNEALYAHAAKNAVIMHCLPMVRGKEITDAMADHENSVLFRQSENRLHAQKALLCGLLG
jgi:ornithine carbamoyltransferase